jgi:hypothetical protein
MTLTRITDHDPNRRGQYQEEVQEFMDTGWRKAITDIYPDKRNETKLMGYRNAIKQLGVQDYIRVVYEYGQFYLERY